MPDDTKSHIRKIGDGILNWVGPAIIVGLIWLSNFMINLKSDVAVINDVKITVDKIQEDSSALWGTASEQNAKIQRLEATIEILQKLVINPAHKVGLVDDSEMPKNKIIGENIKDYMMGQRTKFPAPPKE